jgi:D-aminopeptidase
MSAELLAPEVAQEKIKAAATRAVQRLEKGQAPEPYRIQTPVQIVVEFVQSEMADKAAIFPGAVRGEDRRVEYVAEDMVIAYRAFRTLLALAR